MRPSTPGQLRRVVQAAMEVEMGLEAPPLKCAAAAAAVGRHPPLPPAPLACPRMPALMQHPSRCLTPAPHTDQTRALQGHV